MRRATCGVAAVLVSAAAVVWASRSFPVVASGAGAPDGAGRESAGRSGGGETLDPDGNAGGRAELRLLGGCGVRGPAGEVPGSADRDAWALLGLLAENPAGLARTAGYAQLWPTADPAADRERWWRPMREIRAHLSGALGRPARDGRLVVQRLPHGVYRLNPDLVTCDLWALRAALRRACGLSGAARRVALAAAVDLYTGSFMPGCPHEFALAAGRAVDREVVRALVELADAADDEPHAQAAYLARAAAIDPADEHLCRRRVRVHARLGQFEHARHAFEDLRNRLAEIDARPERETVMMLRDLTTA